MQLDRLELAGFRNYERAEAAFSSGLNMIVGRNGQGKTNLLEAIQTLCGISSHRAPSQTALIRHGSAGAIVRGRVVMGGRHHQIDAEIRAPGGSRTKVNGNLLEPGQQHLALPASVIFSPDDLALIKGGPEQRRHLLDDIAAETTPLAAADRAEFERTLKQRNGILKAAQVSSRAKMQLDVWTIQLAAAASRVILHRLRVLIRLRSGVEKQYPGVAGNPAEVGMAYRPTWAEQIGSEEPENIEAVMARALEGSLERDLERGVTLIGPHRDDLEVELDGVPARIFASQGEQRSLALSLRLAERDLIADARNEPPILLLDDVFSELDENRRRRVAEIVQHGGQSFLTSTEPEAVPLRAEALIRVAGGRLLPVE